MQCVPLETRLLVEVGPDSATVASPPSQSSLALTIGPGAHVWCALVPQPASRLGASFLILTGFSKHFGVQDLDQMGAVSLEVQREVRGSLRFLLLRVHPSGVEPPLSESCRRQQPCMASVCCRYLWCRRGGAWTWSWDCIQVQPGTAGLRWKRTHPKSSRMWQ